MGKGVGNMSNNTDVKILSGEGIPPLGESSANSDKTPYGGTKVNMHRDGYEFSHICVSCENNNTNRGPQYKDMQECAERFERLIDYLHGHQDRMNEAEIIGLLREWNEIKDILSMSNLINKRVYILEIDMHFSHLFRHYEDINEAEMEVLARKVERAFVEYLSYL